MNQPKLYAAIQRASALGLALLLASCALVGPKVSERAGTEQSAETAARKGDHEQAANTYERIAENRSASEQTDLRLSAAREWLAANRPAEAMRVLNALGGTLSPAQSLERSLIDAESALLSNRAAEAWQKINAIAEATAANSGSRYYPLKMRIALATDRPIDGVRAEMAAERYSVNASETTQWRSQLLAGLRAARDRGVKLDPASSSDPIVRGWLELGAIATDTRGVSLNAAAESAAWRAKYPNHPALEILPQAIPAPLVSAAPGGRIALLLPLTGAAASQAAIVRDGFQSAYDQLPQATRPDLRLYDTGALPPAEAIAEAHSAGSNFIVGPLTREDVAAVAALGSQSVPVLALNYLPADRQAPGGMYQFALSPENEARLVARRLIADGHHRGIALVPRGDWGNRVIEAFARELAAGGGSLMAQVEYDSSEKDYGYQIQSVLRVSDSEARLQRLQTVLGTKLNFEPRHRADIEFIFMVTERATNARLMLPQLKFFYAGDIATYALSTAYEPDSIDANRDIDGLIYPDMPWMVSDDGSIEAIRTQISQTWDGKAAWHSRLFAFGYDACQLAIAMSGARRNPAEVQVAGLSGQLRLDPNGRVLRDLIWVQIRDGDPRRLTSSIVNGANID
ncbi:MAG TPA: penicillin-binding protein activator [Steroidobacteraceae bacterium]|nr:penicillin-binding protein activator [Steroidobacteraceae bacterium]